METEITNENLSIPTTYASSTFQELIDRDCTISPITRIPPIDTMYYYARDHIPYYNTINIKTYPNEPEYNPNTNGVTNFSYAFYGMYYCEDTIGSIMNRFDWNSCTDMSYAFRGSAGRYTNLIGSIPFIPKNAINLCNTFNYCPLLSGNIPSIPNSVNDMSGTFYYCYRLKGSIPSIPNSVTNISNTFYNCRNLTGSIGSIGNSVTNMYSTFYNCRNLTGSIPNIPSNVIDIEMAFYNCSSLSSSNVYIYSNNVSNAYYCFYGMGNTMNIYVHANTKTYNTFYKAMGNSTYNSSWNCHLKTF